VIDLNQMVEHFIDGAAESYGDSFLKYDSTAINALKDRSQSAEVRQGHVRSFLRSYSVLQGLNKSEETAIVNEILEFADAHDLTKSPTSEEEILELFDDLHGRCRSKVHPKKDGTFRDLTSLTSKVLWCCYPDAIPMFDSRAGHALCVISYLMGLNRPQLNRESRYEPFLYVWKDLYARIERTIDENRGRTVGIPHKVRVFDTILWTIGGPDF
jgi:hypothetical protein